jgi:TorA maturation chaperone TorD
MAGLKETPRQKMIGMMYLVLTALLALQVSDALLQKFVLLNNSLETANQSAAEKIKEQSKVLIQKLKSYQTLVLMQIFHAKLLKYIRLLKL